MPLTPLVLFIRSPLAPGLEVKTAGLQGGWEWGTKYPFSWCLKGPYSNLMLLTNKPQGGIGLWAGKRATFQNPWIFYSSQWWNSLLLVALPSASLNYNLIMTRDHQAVNDLFWNVLFVFLLKDQICSRLTWNTAMFSRSRGELCHSAMDSNLTITKWTGFLWPGLHRDQSIFCSRLQNLSKDVVHSLYQGCGTWPIPPSSSFCGDLRNMFCWSFSWHMKHTFHVLAPSFHWFYLLPIPFSGSLPSTFQFHIFPGLLSLQKENWLCFKAVIKNTCFWSLLQKFCRTNMD